MRASVCCSVQLFRKQFADVQQFSAHAYSVKYIAVYLSKLFDVYHFDEVFS